MLSPNKFIRQNAHPGSPSNKSMTGQAMVEFVIILLVIMALCSGMLFSSRLLTFEYWAQQEARFLAFEQTWVPAMAYSDAVEDPKAKLEDGEFFHRPDLVNTLDSEKEVEKGGSVTDLLASLAHEPTSIMGGNNSFRNEILMARVGDVGETSRGKLSGNDNLISSAYASQVSSSISRIGGVVPPAPPRTQSLIPGFTPRTRLERGLVNVLHKGGFGKTFCNAGAAKVSSSGLRLSRTVFGATDCAQRLDVSFGVHMARNVDLKSAWRDYGLQLASGFGEGAALEGVVRVQVASQFYSFFDTTIKSQLDDATTELDNGNSEAETLNSEPSVARLNAMLRYMGSSIAVQDILDQIQEVSDYDSSNRKRDAAKALEDDVIEVLHYDADQEPPVSEFFLSPQYLPIPPTFGPAAGGLFSGIMKNVIFYEDDSSGVEEHLIENSNKNVEVSYMADKGLFPAARRRFNTEGKILTSRFYLVTQPWHITRQESATSGYRQLGTQFDDKGEETEEAVLRRRVLGFWLFPSDPVALLDPMVAFFDLGDGLTGVLDAFRDVGSFVGEIKGFLTDNPILDLFDALSEIPGFGQAVPTLPKWPAVRPQAYPYSPELDGDKLMGEERTFNDYLEEQRKFNPKPDPDFGEED